MCQLYVFLPLFTAKIYAYLNCPKGWFVLFIKLRHNHVL